MYGDRGFDFAAVYVGGGTPTVLPREMGTVLEALRKRFSIREVSLETNPNHLTDEILGMLKDKGVNRLSVGVQSFDDGLLKRMERFRKYGSGADIRARLEKTRGIFDTLNVDMIFNFPGQTVDMIARDVRTIIDIEADQVTFYPHGSGYDPQGACTALRPHQLPPREALLRADKRRTPRKIFLRHCLVLLQEKDHDR